MIKTINVKSIYSDTGTRILYVLLHEWQFTKSFIKCYIPTNKEQGSVNGKYTTNLSDSTHTHNFINISLTYFYNVYPIDLLLINLKEPWQEP